MRHRRLKTRAVKALAMVGGTGRTPKELSDHLGAHGSGLGTGQAKLGL